MTMSTVVNLLKHKKYVLYHSARLTFWFLFGAFLGLFFFLGLIFFAYRQIYSQKIFPGIYVNGVDFGGKPESAVETYFAKKNDKLQNIQLVFQSDVMTATISAKNLGFGYDEKLLADQAYLIGRSSDMISNISIMIQAYTEGIDLPPSYHYSEDKLQTLLAPLSTKVDITPVNALFTVKNNRVTAFKQSKDGRAVDFTTLKKQLEEKTLAVVTSSDPQKITISVPITEIKPKITTADANNMGITELVATGTSLFHGSIPSRIYNISLAASRLNGILIPPGQVFSFDQSVGDISSLSGYKQAYVIENGHTVLGDGGGVCQVSTTLFRAALYAGLPIVERHQHAYRVEYYEEDSGPGIDAAIYSPTVDMKFKNDTGHYLLVQSTVDFDAQRLTFNLYGTKDGRIVQVNDPVIVSQSPAPPPLYQDDPSLPTGTVKQIDFAAGGMSVYFTRQVTKGGKIIQNDKFTSNFQPWQAVFLRGTGT